MKFQALVVVPNKLFGDRSYQRLLAAQVLPPLPHPISYEPWIEQPRGQATYVMEREEEKQRFLAFNFWKHTHNQRKRRGDKEGAFTAWKYQNHLREYLTRVNLPLVYSMVARNRGRFGILDWNEAVSEGQICLMRALNGYNVEFAVKFSTYGVRAILRGLMNASIRKDKVESRVGFVELPENYGEDPGQIPAVESGMNEEVDALKHVLDNNLAELSATEKAVVAMRFGLGDKDDLTLEQIGANIGVSKERIRQIQNKALEKIKDALALVS